MRTRTTAEAIRKNLGVSAGEQSNSIHSALLATGSSRVGSSCAVTAGSVIRLSRVFPWSVSGCGSLTRAEQRSLHPNPFRVTLAHARAGRRDLGIESLDPNERRAAAVYRVCSNVATWKTRTRNAHRRVAAGKFFAKSSLLDCQETRE